ncbi:TetR/AcrR family transcriptional regulator [Nocardia terpenica]|uniref:TetR family transcriptional regulator n=1 Tax=Nocardia terpenica TaxID=455432 RepID=A0A164MP60_9NOCA|nr:TetR/AcrR family transcriptional regulator [Nocardia terpenica]KZM73535.1 TetR family transcriptional regulator [Nocardia terpenica]NQE87267.1 TetR/AcrR family transcriptional regulator [Nocardia terpenica]
MSERREAILRASATAIAERGVRGLRVSDVAQVAGVSPGLLYYHFKDRDGLLSAALTYINDQARAYRTAADGTGSPRDRLVNHLLAEIQDTPEVLENSLAWNELRAAAVYERPLREPLARTSRQWNGEVADAIRVAQAVGDIADTVDPDETALIITTLTEGLSSRWLTGELTTEQARTHLRAAIDALLPRRTTKPRSRHAPTH